VIPLSDIDIHQIRDNSGRGIVAVVNVTVGGLVRLTGIRIAHKPGQQPRLILPSRETTARGTVDFFYPVPGQVKAFEGYILDGYARWTTSRSGSKR
jgi:hypothetical protein